VSGAFLVLYSEVFGAMTNDVTGELHNDEHRNFGKVVRKLTWAKRVKRIGL